MKTYILLKSNLEYINNTHHTSSGSRSSQGRERNQQIRTSGSLKSSQFNIRSQLIFKDSFKKIICSWLQGLIWLSLHFLADWGSLWCSASGLRRSRYPCRGLTDALYCHCCYWKLLGLSMDLWKKSAQREWYQKEEQEHKQQRHLGKERLTAVRDNRGFSGPWSLTQKESED